MSNTKLDITSLVDILKNGDYKSVIGNIDAKVCDRAFRKNIYIIHILLARIDSIDQLNFGFFKEVLFNFTENNNNNNNRQQQQKQSNYIKKLLITNTNKNNILHAAAINKNGRVLLQLVNMWPQFRLQKNSQGEIFLHVALKTDYDKDVLNQLIDQCLHCMAERSLRELTPLDILIWKRNLLVKVKFELMLKVVAVVDDVKKGLVSMDEKIEAFGNMPQMWPSILMANDRYKLRSLMKGINQPTNLYYPTVEFVEMYLMKLKQKNNLTMIGQYFQSKINDGKFVAKELFEELTKVKCTTNTRSSPPTYHHQYYNSLVFVLFITGNLTLIPTLLLFCQLDIIPHSILTCLCCDSLLKLNKLPSNINELLKEVKRSCEVLAIKVLNLITDKDMSIEKESIISYLTSKRVACDNKSILDLARLCECHDFVTDPICQKAVGYLWRQKLLIKRKSPMKKDIYATNTFTKCISHTISHLIFLILLCFLFLSQISKKISLLEHFYNIQTVGFMIEEVRQIKINCKSKETMKVYFKNPSNISDLIALILVFGCLLCKLYINGGNVNSNNNNSNNNNHNHHNINNKISNYLLWIRYILVISLILFLSRVFYLPINYKTLGHKILNLLINKDLLPLLFIFAVFVIIFSLTFQCLLVPNTMMMAMSQESGSTTNFGWSCIELLLVICERATFSLVDAYNILTSIDEQKHYHAYLMSTTGRLVMYGLLVMYIAIFIIITAMGLASLIIYTICKSLDDDSEVCWKVDRYKFIKKYRTRSNYPPPFNILELITMFFVHKINQNKSKNRSSSLKNKKDENISVQQNHVTEDSLKLFYAIQASALEYRRHNLNILMLNDKCKVSLRWRQQFSDLEKLKTDIAKRINIFKNGY